MVVVVVVLLVLVVVVVVALVGAAAALLIMISSARSSSLRVLRYKLETTKGTYELNSAPRMVAALNAASNPQFMSSGIGRMADSRPRNYATALLLQSDCVKQLWLLSPQRKHGAANRATVQQASTQ